MEEPVNVILSNESHFVGVTGRVKISAHPGKHALRSCESFSLKHGTVGHKCGVKNQLQGKRVGDFKKRRSDERRISGLSLAKHAPFV